MRADLELFTIGVYGSSADEFFEKLHQHDINVLADIRWRRGVRGAEYAWANRARIEARCADEGVVYWYKRELAPSPEVRAVQYEADKTRKVKKRLRMQASEAFRTAYNDEVLSGIDLASITDELAGLLPEHETPVRVCFFCVEAAAEACHRLLLTRVISDQFGYSTIHL